MHWRVFACWETDESAARSCALLRGCRHRTTPFSTSTSPQVGSRRRRAFVPFQDGDLWNLPAFTLIAALETCPDDRLARTAGIATPVALVVPRHDSMRQEIGRASCRERV